MRYSSHYSKRRGGRYSSHYSTRGGGIGSIFARAFGALRKTPTVVRNIFRKKDKTKNLIPKSKTIKKPKPPKKEKIPKKFRKGYEIIPNEEFDWRIDQF